MCGTFSRALLVLAMIWLSAGRSQAVPPAYDHVVIVIEENEQYQQIIGSFQAPYINSLANGGVSFTNMHAIVHPSQPNYLELFSGSNQGVTGDATPSSKFTTPNLGASLIAAGKTFAGFSEGLPTTGDITSDNVNNYVRRHCPWICWMPATEPLDLNQISRTLHKPFTAFPNDFTQLPTVSFVIPNNLHNMHTGSIQEADNWLKANLKAYADWAKLNNSLLIVTWDEDSFQQANRIPTIFYGANLRAFANHGAWSLHNLLRTLEDMHGLPASGRAAKVSPIVGAFVGEPALATKKFFVSGTGYGPVTDTMVSSLAPDNAFGATTSLKVQATSGAVPVFQSLIKFQNLFGTASTQIPTGANIVSAKLLTTTTTDFGAVSFGTVNLHRMLVPWSEASTFNSLGNGVQTDGAEAVVDAEFSAVPSWSGTAVVFDVTESLHQFQGGAPNEGWLLSSSVADDWFFRSSESASFPPSLEVTYSTDLVGFDTAGVSVTPGGIEARVVVHRFGTGSAPLSVDYSTIDVTAVGGSDFDPVAGTLNWDAGDTTSRTVVIPITADSVVEGNETFRVSLSNLAAGAELDANAVNTVTIAERGFDVWRFNYFGPAANDPQGQPDADPDQDNQTNFQEYAYVTDPTIVDPVSDLVQPSMQFGTLIFAFRRNYTALDITYQVQISDDLITWADGCRFTAFSSGTSTPNMTVFAESFQTGYIVTSVRSLLPSTTGLQFMRVRVTQNP
jgi:acid phosphatase